MAVYYLLIPRYAGRQLVAGNAIAVAWAVAVTANVAVWAHHIYIDYPSGSPQAAINTAMQPTTFALVLPSALSLYSLGFTIYRSRFQWNAASTALFLGLVSWLLAGLSGVVNATITFDQTVHNTLWIVGHFHHMALLNIGLVIFAGIYAWLPDLTGKPLWSESLARWHVWLTFVFGTLNSAFWLVQGLEGAPRRFAVLPGRYVSLAHAAVPVVLILAAAQVLFVWNMVQTLRGAPARVAKPRMAWSDAAAEAAVMLVLLAFAGGAFALGLFLGRSTGGGTKTVTVGGTTTRAAGLSAGKAVFAKAGCGACHTLAAAGSSGTIGPNLDKTKPPLQLVITRVTNGRKAMPSFRGRLSTAEIRAVAEFVSQSAGR